jgi:alanine racemase
LRRCEVFLTEIKAPDALAVGRPGDGPATARAAGLFPLTPPPGLTTNARMATATLTIDLDAIAANWRALDQLSGPTVQTGAVVKADAYGLGAARVARALAQAGARRFFVAVAEEGATVRQALGPGPQINVLSGHMAGDTEMISDLDLTPMLNSLEQITRHLEALPGQPFGVQLDTGMNRLGVELLEWDAVAPILLEAGPVMLMSHLACADEPDHPMNLTQLTQFHEMTDGTGVPRSFAATGGILMGPQYHFDLTRPGIGLYGGRPFDTAEAVVRLPLPVVQTREVPLGETVGYSAAWEAEAPSIIATVQGGYADGLLRSLAGNAVLWDGDIPCPVVGRVSMDMITVDITHLREMPKVLNILGPHQSVDDLADAAGTISYEILTNLGARYARRYVETRG